MDKFIKLYNLTDLTDKETLSKLSKFAKENNYNPIKPHLYFGSYYDNGKIWNDYNIMNLYNDCYFKYSYGEISGYYNCSKYSLFYKPFINFLNVKNIIYIKTKNYSLDTITKSIVLSIYKYDVLLDYTHIIKFYFSKFLDNLISLAYSLKLINTLPYIAAKTGLKVFNYFNDIDSKTVIAPVNDRMKDHVLTNILNEVDEIKEEKRAFKDELKNQNILALTDDLANKANEKLHNEIIKTSNERMQNSFLNNGEKFVTSNGNSFSGNYYNSYNFNNYGGKRYYYNRRYKKNFTRRYYNWYKRYKYKGYRRYKKIRKYYNLYYLQ